MQARDPRRSLREALALALLAGLTAVLAGCGGSSRLSAPASDTQGPTGFTAGLGPASDAPTDRGRMAGRRGFGYPLAVGNRWDYQILSTVRTVSPGVPDVVVHEEQPWTVEIQRTATIESRSYYLEEEFDPRVVRVPGGLFFAMRQDRSGLFERDLALRVGAASAIRDDIPGGQSSTLRGSAATALAGHPHRAAFERATERLLEKVRSLRASLRGAGWPPGGGPDAGEISLLRYPLRVRASWIVRQSPRFTREVVGRERLELPAGSFPSWRIRGGSEFFGPDDRVSFWYASAGLVRIRLHAESDAVDENGNIVGRAIFDSDQRLVAVSLVEDGGPLKHATAPAPGSE